jgi:hypothetical protein
MTEVGRDLYQACRNRRVIHGLNNFFARPTFSSWKRPPSGPELAQPNEALGLKRGTSKSHSRSLVIQHSSSLYSCASPRRWYPFSLF